MPSNDIGIARLEAELPRGIAAVIDLINTICKGIYEKGLRPGILELKIE